MKYIYEILDKIYKKEINVRQLTGLLMGNKKPLDGKDKGEMERKWKKATSYPAAKLV